MTLLQCVALSAGLLGAATLSAHFAWVEAMPAMLEAGKTAKVRIGNGHDLAKSESAVSLDGLKLWAISPSGAKTELKPAAEGTWVTAAYSVKETGVYRFVMTQDRGVMSQTTKGYKPGGRDVHPDAKKSMKIWRSASAVAWTTGAKFTLVKPIGLGLELTGERTADGIALVVLRDGKPHAGADLAIGLPGKEDDEPIGKSDSNGRFVYKAPANAKGPIVFLATIIEPAQKGANYDTNNYAAALHLNW